MLTVTRGRTGRALIDALSDVLADPLDDPLASEVVVVHTHGMERWLSQQLSRRLGADGNGAGVCANVAFPQPAALVGRVMAAVGIPVAAVNAWRPDALTWRLLSLVDRGLPSSLEPLQHRVDAAGDRRLVPLRTLAGQLHRYAQQRPDMVLDWLDPARPESGMSDGLGGQLAPEHRWQADVMRLLADDIGLPSYAEAVVDTVSRLRGGAELPERLERVALFGFTALPAAQLAVLSALGQRIDVDLMVMHPSPGRWDRMSDVRGSRDPRGLIILPARPDLDPTERDGNRLVHAWARDVTELQAVVQTVAAPEAIRQADEDADAPPTTLLEHVQHAVTVDRELTRPTTTAPSQLAADGSMQLHACHGRARQVQVLRDEILRLMSADPTLRPRDILVMCPDVEAFAPLVMAYLAGGGPGRPDLRVRLADRALRATNPLLRTLAELLDLAATRVTASRLRDLLASEPVRHRFGLSPDDLDAIDGWLSAVHMRWGLDATDRAAFRLEGVADNTLDPGLSRLLLGIAMADENQRSIDGITPHDDIEGASVRVVGRLAEFAHRLTIVLAELRQTRTVTAWMEVLANAADRLMLAPFDQPGQRVALTTMLQEILPASGHGSREATTIIGLSDVRDLLADRLSGQPSRANHMTGDLTVCTLVPMRSVPHRVVCLLGMDDEVFPRRPHPHIDDLISLAPRVGDADDRTEDRQLLLDALMAAGQTLLITYTGADEHTGEAVPPCVPVAELLRVIAAMDPDQDLTAALTTRHPLHAHSPKAFTRDRPSFDMQGHRTAQVVPGTQPQGTETLLPAPDRATPIDIEDLVRFAVDPAASFVRQALGVWVPDDPEAPEEHIPVDLIGLDAWQVAEELMAAGAVGDNVKTAATLQAIRGRGQLPPDPLHHKRLDPLLAALVDIAGVCEELDVSLPPPREQAEIDISPGGRRVTGRIAGATHDRVIHVTYSKLASGKQVMRTWVRLLAMTAADPTRSWSALVVGRLTKGWDNPAGAMLLSALGTDAEARSSTAAALLTDLIALYDDGLRTPLIAPSNMAFPYASARVAGKPSSMADSKAAEEWDPSDMGWAKASGAPAHVLVLGGDVRPWEYLAAQPPRPQDVADGHDAEPHRFGGLALRLWRPVLQHMTEWRT